MISAKDEFTLEREMITELQFLLNNSNLSHDELEDVMEKINNPLTEAEFDELQKVLRNRQITSLDRVKNGEYVNQGQINQAVRQATRE